MEPERPPSEKTASAIGLDAALAPEPSPTRTALVVLLRLEQREPPLVRRMVDDGLDEEFWITTPAAADAMDESG
jgi:hypothetical protein